MRIATDQSEDDSPRFWHRKGFREAMEMCSGMHFGGRATMGSELELAAGRRPLATQA